MNYKIIITELYSISYYINSNTNKINNKNLTRQKSWIECKIKFIMCFSVGCLLKLNVYNLKVFLNEAWLWIQCK
jgi:hypothetical protein